MSASGLDIAQIKKTAHIIDISMNIVAFNHNFLCKFVRKSKFLTLIESLRYSQKKQHELKV